MDDDMSGYKLYGAIEMMINGQNSSFLHVIYPSLSPLINQNANVLTSGQDIFQANAVYAVGLHARILARDSFATSRLSTGSSTGQPHEYVLSTPHSSPHSPHLLSSLLLSTRR